MIQKYILNADLYPGNIAFSDLELDIDIPFEQQIDALKEDMLQVIFPFNLILDLGWYSIDTEKGCFQVRVIKEWDWENPIYYNESDNIIGLISIYRESLGFCKGYITAYKSRSYDETTN